MCREEDGVTPLEIVFTAKQQGGDHQNLWKNRCNLPEYSAIELKKIQVFFKLNVKLSNTVHLLVLPAWPICGFSSLTIILSNMVMMQIFLTGIESSFAIVMVLLFLGIVKIRLVGCSCSLIFFSALSCWLLKV